MAFDNRQKLHDVLGILLINGDRKMCFQHNLINKELASRELRFAL